MALAYSCVQVELREVKLSEKPESMLQLSPKATVPVLALADGRVIDESLEVMEWSLAQADPDRWMNIDEASLQLIQRNEHEFKPLLDCYKYADRHRELSPEQHRGRAEIFVGELDQLLREHPYLSGNQLRLTDVAIFPFIRQFAGVDSRWFETCKYAAVRDWMNRMLDSVLFQMVMKKTPFWYPGDDSVFLVEN